MLPKPRNLPGATEFCSTVLISLVNTDNQTIQYWRSLLDVYISRDILAPTFPFCNSVTFSYIHLDLIRFTKSFTYTPFWRESGP